MKSLLCGLFLFLSVSVGLASEPGFTQTLTSEELKAAGLDRLLPAERAYLDALVAKSRQVLATEASQASKDARDAQQKAEAALASQRTAEAAEKAAREEAKLARDEAKKAEIAGSKGNDKGFWAKAKVRLVPGTKIEYAEIKSTIEGNFEGWSGRTVFRLSNGQRWQVANSDERYFVPPQSNVEVEIRAAALGGFWMYFPSLGMQVRVKLLGDK